MKTYTFSLNEYFNKTQKCYYFIDGLFNYTKTIKKEVFQIVDVYGNSYRTDRLKDNVKNNNRELLLKYFNYNMIDNSFQHKYEVCISKIYYCLYFSKKDKIKELLEELEVYINHNNCIKPVFILFKVFAILSLENKKDALNKKVKDDLNYLNAFDKTRYFTDEMAYLYYSIMYYFNKTKDTILLDDYANKYPWLAWFDYNIRANLYYLDFNDAEAAIYYNAALNEYMANYNMERVLHMANNLAYTYNLLGKYQFSLQTTNKIIKYIYTQETSHWIQSITMHYLFSNFMLNRYEDNLDFRDVIIFNDNTLNITSKVILILSAWKCNEIDRVKDIVFSEENDVTFKYFKNLILGNEKDEIDVKKISITPYIETILNKVKQN